MSVESYDFGASVAAAQQAIEALKKEQAEMKKAAAGLARAQRLRSLSGPRSVSGGR